MLEHAQNEARRGQRAARLAVAMLFGLVAWALASLPARAHDIPDRVVVAAFVKQREGHADMLVRVPLALLLDLDLPKYGPGYLDLARIGPALERAGHATAQAFVLAADGAPLAHHVAGARIALPSDRSFADYDGARAAIYGPALPATETVVWNQGFCDVHLTYALPRPGADLALKIELSPALGERMRIGLRYIAPDGAVRGFDISGGLAEFRLDPRWHHAAGLFVAEGIRHILGGIDHLLFLLLLVVPFRRRPAPLFGVVTGFTLGHSVTLIAASLGFAPGGAWFPPVIETLIAASILYMAIENAIGPRLDRRWLLAAGFGLVHGFGFAGALGNTLQFAGSHLVAALLFFNLGIEIGQILALLVAIPALNLLLQAPAAERWGALVISVLVGHEAWHWLTERASAVPWAELAALDLEAAYRAVLWLVTLAFLAALAATVRPFLARSTKVLTRLMESPGTIETQRKPSESRSKIT